MSDPSSTQRQLNYTIEAFERTIQRVEQEVHYEVAQLRGAYAGEIARLGVRLNELTDKIDGLLAAFGALKADVQHLQEQAAHEAQDRPERQRAFDERQQALIGQIDALADSHERLRQWLYLWLAVVSGAALVLLGLISLVLGVWWMYGR